MLATVHVTCAIGVSSGQVREALNLFQALCSGVQAAVCVCTGADHGGESRNESCAAALRHHPVQDQTCQTQLRF